MAVGSAVVRRGGASGRAGSNPPSDTPDIKLPATEPSAAASIFSEEEEDDLPDPFDDDGGNSPEVGPGI